MDEELGLKDVPRWNYSRRVGPGERQWALRPTIKRMRERNRDVGDVINV